MSTYWKYGQYTHPANEINVVNLTVRNIHSGRGVLKHVLYTYELRGEICASTTTDITTRILEIENAYSVERQNCGLYLDNNVPTAHILNSNHPNNISGNRILVRPSFPDGGAEEYATGRTYSIVIQALFASPEQQIIEYNETIEYIGDCGPDWDYWPTVNGQWQPYLKYPTSIQRIIQRGSSVGFNGYAIPFGAILPQNEHTNLRVWKPGTPNFKGQQYSEFPLEWAFIMSSNTAQGSPPLAP